MVTVCDLFCHMLVLRSVHDCEAVSDEDGVVVLDAEGLCEVEGGG